ncbi:MAG: 16S rRNA (guanine(966)-N(2))-methyltransferase RsmD [Oscillospiraceae bacterium]|nr:16S rRNA (guanine(966)-N(2))-methyltransferase RsmD [Oscillospiraceae bacterium]
MRVISGEARGRKLKTLQGLDTRPTGDKVKQAIFNIIQFDIEGRHILDLFAGTGQLAIEALSRGAADAVLVDSSPEAVQTIRENLSLTGLADRARVIREDAAAYLDRHPGPFDLVFLDPPYRAGLLSPVIKKITTIDILSESGIIICESPADLGLPDVEAPYVRGRTYSYGKTRVTLYHREPGFGA